MKIFFQFISLPYIDGKLKRALEMRIWHHKQLPLTILEQIKCKSHVKTSTKIYIRILLWCKNRLKKWVDVACALLYVYVFQLITAITLYIACIAQYCLKQNFYLNCFISVFFAITMQTSDLHKATIIIFNINNNFIHLTL